MNCRTSKPEALARDYLYKLKVTGCKCDFACIAQQIIDNLQNGSSNWETDLGEGVTDSLWKFITDYLLLVVDEPVTVSYYNNNEGKTQLVAKRA